MRLALATALAGACLLTGATAASAADFAPASDAALSIAQSIDGPLYRTTAQITSNVRVSLDAARRTGRRGFTSGRIRMDAMAMDVFPMENGLRLSLGARKERTVRAGLRSFGPNGGERLVVGGIGGFGNATSGRRRLIPGANIGYDMALDGATRFSIEGGVRMARRDGMTSQLVRLAALGDRSEMLASRSGRFGPAMRVSMIHRF